MGLPYEREKVFRGGRLGPSDRPEQSRDRGRCDRSFLAIEVAGFAGLKLIDHVRFPTVRDEA